MRMSRPYPVLKIEGPPGSGKSRALVREVLRVLDEEGLSADKALIVGITPANIQTLKQAFEEESRHANRTFATSPCFQTHDLWALSQASTGEPLSERDGCALTRELLGELLPPDHPLGHLRHNAALARQFYRLIRQLQQRRRTPQSLASVTHPAARLLAQLYRQVDEKTRQAGLATQEERLAQGWQAIAERAADLGEMYPVIAVDEAQECSAEQLSAVLSIPTRLILTGHAGLSVRGYRGAEPKAYAQLTAQADRPLVYQNLQTAMRGNEALLNWVNVILAEPLWEQRTPDPDALARQSQMYLASDPADEAAKLAKWIVEQRNRPLESGEEPARWSDFVVFLRSSTCRDYLLQAFQVEGIPVCAPHLSESSLQRQHQLYDVLKAFSVLNELGLTPAHLLTSVALQRGLAELTRPRLDIQDRLDVLLRHGRRWLEATQAERVYDGGMASYLQHLAGWERLLGGEDVSDEPGFAPEAMVRQWMDWWRDWHRTDDVWVLCARIMAPAPLSRRENEPDAHWEQSWAWFEQKLSQSQAHYRRLMGRSMPLDVLLESYTQLWEGEDAERKGVLSDAVRLSGIHALQGADARFVLIPFMIQGEYPKHLYDSELIPQDDPACAELGLSLSGDPAEESRLLALAITRARQAVWLSAHRQQNASMPVMVSADYERLCQARANILKEVAPNGLGDALEGPVDFDLNRYRGQSVWAGLEPQPAQPIFDASEHVGLSASAMKTYMQCPRQFYYRNVLRLPSVSNVAAIKGQLTHRLLEVFNQKAPPHRYTAEALREYLNALFSDGQETPSCFEQAGFNEREREQLAGLGVLERRQFYQTLQQSIDSLEAQGYFTRYQGLQGVSPEMPLPEPVLDGLSRCRLSGTLDAVMQRADGQFEILDYKTSRSAYKTGLDTCRKHFEQVLAPLPDDEALSHDERFAARLKPSYPLDYQLLLYYYACSQKPEYRGRIASVALQFVRPKESGESICLDVPAEQLDASRDTILQDIQRFVIDPILAARDFETTENGATCEYCDYVAVCDRSSAAGDDE